MPSKGGVTFSQKVGKEEDKENAVNFGSAIKKGGHKANNVGFKDVENMSPEKK